MNFNVVKKAKLLGKLNPFDLIWDVTTKNTEKILNFRMQVLKYFLSLTHKLFQSYQIDGLEYSVLETPKKPDIKENKSLTDKVIGAVYIRRNRWTWDFKKILCSALCSSRYDFVSEPS